MAHYREIPCLFYVKHGECSKGRPDANHKGVCQKCKKYKPRAKVHLINKKKQYNEKQRSKNW